MKLIIVESPTKARTLTRFLDGKFTIEATLGHIRDLPKADLGVDIEHDFTPRYVIPKDRQKRVGELRELAKKAESIILATDPDREGEAIAWHTASLLAGSDKQKKISKKGGNVQNASRLSPVASRFSRIVFHEITEHAIKEALAHPRDIDLKLVDAQQARRVLDRLVGYKLSPLLWQKLSKRWLSAGRVQSVAVRLIVEREREIQKFAKEEFWTIEGVFLSGEGMAFFGDARQLQSTQSAQSPSSLNETPPTTDTKVILLEKGRGFSAPQNAHPHPSAQKDMTVLEKASFPGRDFIRAQLVSKDGVKYEKTLTYDLFDGKYTTTSSTISNQQLAIDIIKDLFPPYTVTAVDKKEIKRAPLAPFTTSTLQQEAGRRFYFSAKRTMQLAQKLYEEGYITYHRTDSVNLSEKFIGEARQYIEAQYGTSYVPQQARRFQTKSKVAQEAHEAIRPTTITISSDQLPLTSQEINRDHHRLYDLIWKRALASQVKEAIFDSTTIAITSSNGYRFETQGSVVKFDGYLKIVGHPASSAGGENGEVTLPNVTIGQVVNLKDAIPTQHVTNPPPRYTEASLVKTLEEKDIGRPSTYAPIISTIGDRQYVTHEEKKLLPTDLGNSVTDFLVQYFPDIMDLPFTATLEAKLDAIANGESTRVPVIADFYGPFAKSLEHTYEEAEKVKVPVEEIDEKCPSCSSPLVKRSGRYGKFIACSTFPKCKYTRQFFETIDKKCPHCGGDIVIKKSRRGKTFYGCSNYPTCTFAAWKREDIK